MLRWGGSSAEIREKQGDGHAAVDKMARGCAEAGTKVRCGGGIGAEKCEEKCAAVGRFLSRNKGKAVEDACTALGEMARNCEESGAGL